MEFGFSNYYILAEVVSCGMSILLFITILLTFSFYDKRQRLFLFATISTFLASFFNVLSIFCIANYKVLPLSVCEVITTFYFLFLLMCPFFMADYSVDIATSFTNKKFIGYSINGSVQVIYLLIVLLNFRTGWIFKYDATEGYVRGPLKNITYVITAFYSLYIMLTVFLNRQYLARRIMLVFGLYPFVSFFFVAVQFFFPNIVMTGIASFASVFFAYLVIQSYLIEVDLSTGLMTEGRLRKRVTMQKKKSVLFVFTIDNINLVQSSMDINDWNKMLLKIGILFSSNFPNNSYHISTNRFAGIGKTKIEVNQKADSIIKAITELGDGMNSFIPIPIDYYCASVEFSSEENDYDSLMDIINIILTKAKENQLRSLQFCDEAIMVDRERKRYIYRILKRELDLDSNQFQVWFQPIYSVEKQQFTYMEALSRLNGTELGDIPPQEFVYVAENRGLIERLGFVAFEKVCKFISANRELVKAVSINFSVYQMTNKRLVQNVLESIKRFELNPSNIIMEVTESTFIDNFEVVSNNMKRLANAGVKFYLDDFGTGYSNLANVISLPFSTIKIDRSLVLMMEESERGVKLFMNLIKTFKDAGLKILVEGVETKNQNSLIEKAGVDYIQGFLFSRPLAEKNCIEFLSKANSKIIKTES